MILAALLPAVALAVPPADGVDLSVRAEIGRPRLVTLEGELDGNVTLTLPSGPTDLRLTVRRSLRLVDEFQEQHEDRWRATRRVVRWFREEDGAVRDPELNGVTLSYAQEEGQGEVNPSRGRQIRPELLDRLAAQIGSVGVYVPLPSAAEAMKPFDFDGASIASFLLGLDGELVDARGALQLEGLDAEGLATVRGRLLVRERQVDGGMRFDSRYDGDLEIVVDTSGHRVVRISFTGKATSVGGEGSIGVDARSRFKVELEAKDGEDAEEIAAEAVVHRDVPRALEGLGVSLSLPSHWFPVSTEKGAGFVSSLLGSAGAPTYLEVLRLEVPVGQVDEAYRRARESMTGDGATVEEVRSPLGDGLRAKTSSDGAGAVVEVYPLPDALIRVRIQATPEALDAVLVEYEAIQASLRRT